MAYTPEEVGHRFVKQYYETLNSKPQSLHVFVVVVAHVLDIISPLSSIMMICSFYDQKSSSLSHGEEGSRQPNLTGQKV